MNRCCRVRFAALILLLTSSTMAQAGFITEIVSFGDSLTDTGNVYNFLGDAIVGPPYYQGHFSNGPVYIERLAERLGIAAPTPSRTGGMNYAYGGAQTGSGNSSFVIPNISTQVSTYMATLPAANPGQLFVLWGGANDFLGTQTNANIPINNLSGNIVTLSGLGAMNFLIPNLPPLGSTPGKLGGVDEVRLNDLTVAFNHGLETELSRLESSLGVNIYRLDTYGLIQDALSNPVAYGLTNVTDAAYNATSGSVVVNPNEYLFWDTLHPTATAHRFIGDRAFASVPEPAASLVVCVMLANIFATGRKRLEYQKQEPGY